MMGEKNYFFEGLNGGKQSLLKEKNFSPVSEKNFASKGALGTLKEPCSFVQNYSNIFSIWATQEDAGS